MDTEQLLTVAQAPPSVQQQYGAPQQLATNYFLLAAEQQPATIQQVVQPPQAPVVPSAPIQHVNQVAPQYSAPQYQAPQYRGGNHCAQQIVTVSIVTRWCVRYSTTLFKTIFEPQKINLAIIIITTSECTQNMVIRICPTSTTNQMTTLL